ncbi:MAG: CPBP family intramembrane metalloprotease, partial [Proteobacteria bacterium]|nr:CPBP family intramembrane metalloprotease [Pseudomonadota bacterium]
GSISIALLALYLLLVEPWLGRAAYRRMLAALNAGDTGARLRFYLSWIWQGWALVAVTLLVTLVLAGWAPARLGLQLPDWPYLPALDSDALGGFAVGGAIGAALVIGLILGIGVASKRRRSGGAPDAATQRTPKLAGNRDLLRMLPRTRNERFGFAALAVTAGIGEEVVWRGFGLTLLFALLPTMHPAVPIVLAALAFGFAHWYQGAIGVLATAVIGALLATLFWASGSLLWPMFIHVLIDLRVLLVRAPAHATTGDSP